jgi:hydroxymethylpyrimidine pyrophosphatase-like HAD family hydrolase
MDPRANKGLAVRQLQQLLQISPEECAAFGDYMNDYEMMGAVHYSYAMENAHPQLKAAARFRAKSNREGGVLLAIKELVASLK